MKKLIINADDFGYRENINKGIVYAHQNGLVTSASLFVEREGTLDAIRLAKENPALGLGLHLDLDKFFEVDHAAGKIVKLINPQPAIEIVKDEARRQIEKYFSFGFTADHIDSHHHAHLHTDIFYLVCQLAKEYKIPVVRFFQKYYSNIDDYNNLKNILAENKIYSVDHFIEGWYWGNVDENYTVAELMTHPGYNELWREAELANCCQPQLKQYFVDQQIEILKFSDIFLK